MKPSSSSTSDRGGSRTETFKSATTAVVKAISGQPETTVVYTASAGKPDSDTGSETCLPLPPVKLTTESVTRLRGAADSLALRLRHHDSMIHARRMPSSKDALDAYNVMEQARVETLGARRFTGVGKNISQAMEQRLTNEGCQTAQTFFELQMTDALKVMMLDHDKHVPLGPTASHVRDLYRAEFGKKLDPFFDDLVAHADNQRQCTNILRKLIEALELEQDDAPQESDEEERGDENEDQNENQEQDDSESQDSSQSSGDDQETATAGSGAMTEMESDDAEGEPNLSMTHHWNRARTARRHRPRPAMAAVSKRPSTRSSRPNSIR